MTFFKLIRYKNLIMVLLTMVLVKYALLNDLQENSLFSTLLFSISAFSILCLTAAGYVVNDILDSKADLINKPNKVFVGNKISTKNAWWMYSILNLVGITICIYVIEVMSYSYSYLVMYLLTGILLYLYSAFFKKWILIGNLIIAGFCAGIVLIVFVLEIDGQDKSNSIWHSVGDSIQRSIVFMTIASYMIFSFLTTLVREIIKDIEDIDGDYQMKMKTLPIVLGRRRARNVAIGLSILLVFLLMVVLKILLEDSFFLSLATYLLVGTLLPTIYFTYKLWSAKKKKHFHLLSNMMKMIMFFGILSMILFTFNP